MGSGVVLRIGATAAPHPTVNAVRLGWFHRYPARFSADVIQSLFRGTLARATGPVTMCLDPFAGTGATIAVARQLRINAVGIELTTLGVEIARLRLSPPTDLEGAVNLLDAWVEARPPVTADVGDELHGWLGDANSRVLGGMLVRLADIDDEKLARFARIALSQSLRPASRWLSGSVKLTADPARTPLPLGAQLRKWARTLARDCRLETEATRGSRSSTEIVQGDSRRLTLADDSIDIAISSPPYFVTYDYFEVNRLSYLAFGWPMPRGEQVGMRSGHDPDGVGFVPPAALTEWYLGQYAGETTALGRALRAYCQSMRSQLAELGRVVKPGGVIGYAIADSTRKGKAFELSRAVREMMEEAGFVDLYMRKRGLGDRHILPVYRNATSGRFASEGIDGITERLLFARIPAGNRRSPPPRPPRV